MVRHRIYDTFDDIFDQVTTAARTSKYGFTMQLDKSADVTNCSQLLVYAKTTENELVKTELLRRSRVQQRAKRFLHRG